MNSKSTFLLHRAVVENHETREKPYELNIFLISQNKKTIRFE